jgi:hypothetical protein
MSDEAKFAELQRLRSQVAALESELASGSHESWAPKHYYTAYHLLGGMVLGLIASVTSLLFNIVGAAMFGKHPFELIRVYLTFPMGEKALSLDAVDHGFVLAAGCCLYLMTGMIGGVPFHMVLTRYFGKSSGLMRFLAASGLGLGIWIINFYAVLSWLQPALIGGNWIVERIPLPVAAATHLVFAWTMLLVEQWGRFEPPGARTGTTEGSAA